MAAQYQGHRLRCPNLTLSLSAVLAPPSATGIRDLITLVEQYAKKLDLSDAELYSRLFLLGRSDMRVNEFLEAVKRYHADSFRALGPAANETRPDGTALWWPRFRSLIYVLFCLNVPRCRMPAPPAAIAASACARTLTALSQGLPTQFPAEAGLDVGLCVGEVLDPFATSHTAAPLATTAHAVSSAPGLPSSSELPAYVSWAQFEAECARLFDAYGCAGWTRRTMGQASVAERRPLVMLCLVCCSSASYACPDCNFVHYCSEAHRALDAPSHAAFCAYLQSTVTRDGPREGDPLAVFRAYDRTSHEVDYGGAILVGPHGCGAVGCSTVFLAPSNGTLCGGCRSAVFCAEHAHLATASDRLTGCGPTGAIGDALQRSRGGNVFSDSAVLQKGVSHASEAHPTCYELSVAVRARRAMALRGFRYTASAEAVVPKYAFGVLQAIAAISRGRTAAAAQAGVAAHETDIADGRTPQAVQKWPSALYGYGPLLRKGMEVLASIQQALHGLSSGGGGSAQAASYVSSIVGSAFKQEQLHYAAGGWFALMPDALSRLTVAEAVAAIDGLSFPLSISFGLVASGVAKVGRRVRVSAAAYAASGRPGGTRMASQAPPNGPTREVVVARLLMVGADETEFALIPVLHQLLHLPPFDSVDVLDIVMMGPRMPISTVLALPHELCADCAAAGRRMSIRYVSCYFDHYLSTLTDHAPGPWGDTAYTSAGQAVASHDYLQNPNGPPAAAPPVADVQCACDGPLKDTVNKGAPSGCSWCVPPVPPVGWGIDSAMAARPDVLSIFHGGLFIGTTTTTAGGSSLSDAIRDAAARWPGLPVVTTAYEVDEAVRQTDVLTSHCNLEVTADICPNPFGSLFAFTTWINTIRCTSNLGVCVGFSRPLPPQLSKSGAVPTRSSPPLASTPPLPSSPPATVLNSGLFSTHPTHQHVSAQGSTQSSNHTPSAMSGNRPRSAMSGGFDAVGRDGCNSLPTHFSSPGAVGGPGTATSSGRGGSATMGMGVSPSRAGGASVASVPGGGGVPPPGFGGAAGRGIVPLPFTPGQLGTPSAGAAVGVGGVQHTSWGGGDRSGVLSARGTASAPRSSGGGGPGSYGGAMSGWMTGPSGEGDAGYDYDPDPHLAGGVTSFGKVGGPLRPESSTAYPRGGGPWGAGGSPGGGSVGGAPDTALFEGRGRAGVPAVQPSGGGAIPQQRSRSSFPTSGFGAVMGGRAGREGAPLGSGAVWAGNIKSGGGGGGGGGVVGAAGTDGWAAHFVADGAPRVPRSMSSKPSAAFPHSTPATPGRGGMGGGVSGGVGGMRAAAAGGPHAQAAPPPRGFVRAPSPPPRGVVGGWLRGFGVLGGTGWGDGVGRVAEEYDQ